MCSKTCLMRVFDIWYGIFFRIDRFLFAPENKTPPPDFEVVSVKTFFKEDAAPREYDYQDFGYWLNGQRYNIIYREFIEYPPYGLAPLPEPGATGLNSRVFDDIKACTAFIEYRRKVADLCPAINPISYAIATCGDETVDITEYVRRYAGPSGDFYKTLGYVDIKARHILRNVFKHGELEEVRLEIYDTMLEKHGFGVNDTVVL